MIQITEILQQVNITVEESTNTVNIEVAPIAQTVNIEVAEMGLQGLQGPPGESAEIIFNEVPIGVLNGINATFTSVFDFVSGTLQVFLNGSLQKIVDDYQVIGNNTITLNFSPMANENILINYIKQE